MKWFKENSGTIIYVICMIALFLTVTKATSMLHNINFEKRGKLCFATYGSSMIQVKCSDVPNKDLE